MIYIYCTCMAISVLVLLAMSKKDYENIDTQYWTIAVLIPVIILSYWQQSIAQSPGEALIANCYTYLDSTVMLSVMLFSIIRHQHIRGLGWFKTIIYALAFAHLLFVCMNVHTKLYYSDVSIQFVPNMGMAVKYGSGALKVIHYIYLGLMAVLIIAASARAHLKKGNYSRKTLDIYIGAVAAAMIIYVVESVMDFGFSLLPILYTVMDVMLYYNYDRVYCHNIAALVSINNVSHENIGYAAFDLKGEYLSSNIQARRYLPVLSEFTVDERIPKEESEARMIFYDTMQQFVRDGAAEITIENKNKYLELSVSYFSLRNEDAVPQGFMFAIRDVTREQIHKKELEEYNRRLSSEVSEQTAHIMEIQQKIVLGIADMIENRDNSTGGHVKRTSDVIHFIVEEALKEGLSGLTPEMAADIVRAAPMHDLGKISIDNSILCKPGKLTDEEFVTMKSHAAKSGEIVLSILEGVEEQHFVELSYRLARHHHERWDGRGYPDGLIGEMIPLEARIMAIADVYDALVSRRCYKEPMSFPKASAVICEGMGTQFDPSMKPVFLRCRRKLEDYYTKSNREQQEAESHEI